MYQLTNAAGIIRLQDAAFIPNDENNGDWLAYKAWLDAGNKPLGAAIAPINWDEECQRRIADVFSAHGVNQRGSMNTWAASVALTAPNDRDADDLICAAMTPLLNNWEGAMASERDRLKATPGALLFDARWPEPPDGAAAFVQSCGEGG